MFSTLYTLRSVANALIQPTYLVILVILGIIFYKQNVKTTLMQKMIVGKRLNSPLELTISQIVIGIFGAVVASLLLTYLGIVFHEDSMIDLIFLISILFVFINPRFICFSYSGAALGLISIFLNQLSIMLNTPSLDFLKIDPVALMSLVAIIHFVEGIMVMLDGTRGAIPVFTNKGGKISGGFALKRYWILPISLLFIIQNSSTAMMSKALNVQNWLHILEPTLPINLAANIMLGALTFYGVIGYESITFTKTKEKKVFSSGISIIIYSIALFSMAQLARLNIVFKILLLIFAPLGHEAMIFIQKYFEVKNQCIYVSNEEGIRVLEVAPGSPAYEMGIKSGDLLLDINDKKINSEKDILEAVNNASTYILLKAKKITGEFKELKYSNFISNKGLGVVLVPKDIPKSESVIRVENRDFKDILEKHKKNKK
ncbi:PDZ domain-containing protein [Haloimpatiens sp. FM7330]|uniref:PDZ domain-containing protein n=1 Tax=Haloimpatiens sp. FM7330 TaxID=3298610 RepID=UPI0036401581